MNFLGPCLNPAQPKIQLLGVADPAKLQPVALTLAALGVERALVVHGAGLDEVGLHDETVAVRLLHGQVEQLIIRPEDAGLERAPVDAIKGGDPAANASQLTALLEGRSEPAGRDLVLINAGALLMTAGPSRDLMRGVALARDALLSGAAARLLSRYVEASNG